MDIVFLYLIVSATVCCVGLIYFFYEEGNFKMIIFLKILLIILLFFLPKLHDGISNKLETINLIIIITLDLIIGYFMRKKRRGEFKEKMKKRKIYEQGSDYLRGFEDAIDDLL